MPSSNHLKELAGPVATPLKLGFAAFVLGGAGFAFAMFIDYGPGEPLSFVALGIVVLAVATGFIAVIWGWASMLRKIIRKTP